jgi:hypothetical protein
MLNYLATEAYVQLAIVLGIAGLIGLAMTQRYAAKENAETRIEKKQERDERILVIEHKKPDSKGH